MAEPAAPYYIPQEVQDKILSFCKSTQLSSFNPANVDLRTRFKKIDIEYIRENNLAVEQQTSTAAANAMGNKRKIQDIVIPLVEPQTESALAYLTSVFLTGNPIFGVVSDPSNMEAAKQMEAVIADNSIYGGWARHFMLFFRDGLKYNFHALEVAWCQEKIYSVETDVAKSSKNGTLKDVLWQGNKIKRLDPYNTIFDPTVPITEQHTKAEFTGYVELFNRVSLMQLIQSYAIKMNVTKAFESSLSLGQGLVSLYYVPEVFLENLSGMMKNVLGVQNWDAWANIGSNAGRTDYKNLYQVITRYVRIVPKDFGMRVPANGNVQIWKFVTVNDAVIIYAERLSNAHGFIPIIFGQPIEDGLNLQTKSFAQKQIPLQDIASSLANGRMAARRRAVVDRGLYDPSRIDPKHMNDDSPTAKIPVRPSAYGQPLDRAYYPIPFRDEQSTTVMQDVREVMGYGDYLSGQNKAQQGQFVKGNKTRSEYEDVQHKASGRQQTMAINIEHQVMGPIKQILKYNILQYQPQGPMYSYVEKTPININPQQLRQQAMVFKVSDGLDPADKIMDGDTLSMALQVAGQSQTIAERYDVGGMFTQLIAIKGVDLTPFKFSDQQLQQNNANAVALEQAKRTVPGQPGQPAPGQPQPQQVQPPQAQPAIPVPGR